MNGATSAPISRRDPGSPGSGRALCVRALWLAAGAAAVGWPAWAAAASDDNKIIFPNGSHATTPTDVGSGGANLFAVVVALLIAGFGAWWYLRKRQATGVVRDGRTLLIEETRSLGNRQYLVVASYEDKKFLLGVCPGRIDMLAPLHQADDAERS